MSPRSAGVLLCVASAMAYGATGIFGKLAIDEGLSVAGMLAARFAIAAVVLWVIVAAMGGAVRPSRRGVAVGVALGLVVYAAQAGFYFWSLTRLDAAFTILLVQVAPALVALGAVVFGRERLTPTLLVSLPIAFVGTALVATGARVESFDGVGVLLALCCAVAYAAYMLLSHATMERVHPVPFAASVCTGSALAFGTVAIATGTLPRTGGAGWTLILAMALIATVIAITFLAMGTARIGPSTAVLLQTVEPLTATVLALMILEERLQPLQWLGAALILGAVVALALTSRRPAPRPMPD